MANSALNFEGAYLNHQNEMSCSFFEFLTLFANLPNASHREKILQTFLSYTEALMQVLGDTPFRIWINGSFVTQKAQPQDLDFVVFLAQEDWKRLQKDLKPLVRPIVGKTPRCIYAGLLDAYIDPEIPSYLAEWRHRFSSVTRRGNKVPGQYKGFIELQF